MTEPNRSTTERGFTTYDDFTDTHGNRVWLQTSSSAKGPCVWIFATGQPASGSTSPHLDVEQAKRLRDALGAFITEEGNG